MGDEPEVRLWQALSKIIIIIHLHFKIIILGNTGPMEKGLFFFSTEQNENLNHQGNNVTLYLNPSLST